MTNDVDSYKSIFLDLTLRDFWTVSSLIRNEQRLPSCDTFTGNLIELWSEKNHRTNHYYLPLLCVRTGFDLFLRANRFAHDSEIIMSAINIPSMITLVQYHQLKVIPCDIDRQTFAMNVNEVKRLITPKTVAIVYAHIYGRCVDVDELVNLAYERGIHFIEDCAESFTGFCSCSPDNPKCFVDLYCPSRQKSNIAASCYSGHPRSHLVLYSFGVLKFCTALGGGFAKVADRNLYEKMSQIYREDPVQDSAQYGSNVKKYFYLYWVLNSPYFVKSVMYVIRLFKLNHMEYVVHHLRAFATQPTSEQLFLSLRRQPCRPLLAFLYQRFQQYDSQHLQMQREKGMYVLEHLVKHSTIELIGMNCAIRNFWLFPIIVAKPDLFVKMLSKYHIDAYRGTTQLNVITKLSADTDQHRCPNAEYLIEHVIYLPVHCHVPMGVLNQLIAIVNRIAKQMEEYPLRSKL